MQDAGKVAPETLIETKDIVTWAERLNVTPEELRSAVQKGGESVKDVVEELRRRGLEAHSTQQPPDRVPPGHPSEPPPMPGHEPVREPPRPDSPEPVPEQEPPPGMAAPF